MSSSLHYVYPPFKPLPPRSLSDSDSIRSSQSCQFQTTSQASSPASPISVSSDHDTVILSSDEEHQNHSSSEDNQCCQLSGLSFRTEMSSFLDFQLHFRIFFVRCLALSFDIPAAVGSKTEGKAGHGGSTRLSLFWCLVSQY